MRLLTAVVVSILQLIFALQSVSALDYRLSKDVYPISYNITIKPYFLPEDGDKRFTFSGETSIIIQTRKTDVREFAVHADYLEFIEVNMWSESGRDLKFTSEYETKTDKLIFRIEEALASSINYTLNFKYTGRISNGMDGLYRINYTDNAANEKWMIATQLQRIDARKLFPSFDEPCFKAVFNMHISRPNNYRSFSNTDILSTTIDEKDPSRYVDHFKETPIMSTYLVAMVVADYKPRGKNNLRIISRPEYYNKTQFSYEVTEKILKNYNILFDYNYVDLGNAVLQKLSLSKFPHNGMENWGLMLYKDDVLIFEDGNTDLSGMQYMITIISHETSHSWFGDSITFEWWGYFWLNEGFARYYQYFATDKVYPEYELNKQFVVDQLHTIFNTDALNSTQPLSEPDVASPSEIARKFSAITYVKGASIIRMISNAMSEATFQVAMNHYIKANRKRSVIPADLLNALKIFWPSSPIVDVEKFFYDWTEQVGFPLLTVTMGHDMRSVRVQQKRYLFDPKDGSDPNLRYTIPLTYATSKKPDFTNTFPVHYFKKDRDEIIFNFAEPVEWVMFNIQQSSYYRVMYENSTWYKLHYALYAENWSGIHEINRAQFIDDLLAFAKSALLDYELVFKLLEYLETEIHYTPWEAAFTGFKYVSPYLTVEEHIDFGNYILFVSEKVFKKLGVSGTMRDETVLDIYNRKQVVNFNCKYGRKACTTEVQSILRKYLYDGTVIPVDIRSTIYCSGMRDGSEEDFDKLFDKFKAESVLREKLRMRYGLGCVRNSKNIEKFFEAVLSDAIAVAEKDTAMAPLYKENPENVWPVYQIVTTRFEEVAIAFDSWLSTANLISSVATLLTTAEQRNAFEEFIVENRNKFGAHSGVLDNALSKLDKNLEWAENHLSHLRVYLKSRNGASATSIINVLILALAVLCCFK